MKEYINPTVLSGHYDLPSHISITNHLHVWNAFDDYVKGSFKTLSKNIIDEFFLKISALVLVKIYPTITSSYDSNIEESSDNNLEQKDKLHEIYLGFIDYYMTRIESHIQKMFPIPPTTPLAKNNFVSYFLTKGTHILSSINRRNGTYEKRVDKSESWEVLLGGEYPDPLDKVIAEENALEWIESLTPRQRDGKKNKAKIEEIYRKREWDKKQLVGFYGTIAELEDKPKTLSYYIEKNPDFILDSLLLPVKDKLLIIPKFIDNEHLDFMWKIFLSGNLPERRKPSDKDREAIAAIRKKVADAKLRAKEES